VRLQIIRVPDAQKAQDLERRLGAGEEFAALAREHSVDPSAARGGELGAVRPTDLAAPLRKAAEQLKPGATSPAFDAGNGWVILKRLPD
jgi:parvulin-like peptidyl-prolyl isomerase